MIRAFSKPRVGMILAGAVCIAVMATVAFASTCLKKGPNHCKSTTTFSVYTGGPPVPACQIGEPIWEITSSATCGFQGAGPTTQLRCGVLADAIIYSGAGLTHVIEPVSGHNWNDAAGNCAYLSYTNY